MKLHTLYIYIMLLAGISCSGCIREDEYDNSPHGNLYALWNIINEQYCFLDYKEQTLDFKWNDMYAKYASRLSSSMDSYQLFEVMCDMLSELRDGHVNLYNPHDVGRYWSWYEDYPTNFNEELQRKYLSNDYRIASGIKYKILDDNIGYIYCGDFSTAIGNGNLDEIMHYLRTCNGLIVDVRNNSGGQLTNAEILSRRFTNKRILVGYTAHKTGPGRNNFSTPEPEYLEPSTGIRWQKKVVLLTNRRCYSATNTFVRNMKECPNVTVLGDQTGGGSGLPFCSELPNGWLIRFSACPMYTARMEHIEFGIAPDVNVSLSLEDALRGEDTLIEEARLLLNISE
ncbi:MAG: S41 family peptidase [Paraprevotella sp.]|nr:S41 family peptidase [Paraprevotella sp.]